MSQEELFATIRENLQPERPVRSVEHLRGRTGEYEATLRELRHFDGLPFIFGHRGVGKTSLARTAAQMATKSDREHIYVACAPGSKMLEIFREVGEGLLALAIRFDAMSETSKRLEMQLAVNPYVKTSIEKRTPELPSFRDANEAVRTLKGLDSILPGARETVVVIDELEELDTEDRNALAFLVKQIGDQEFSTRFLLVGIAENVHELIGAHESVPRYITEVPLKPLIAQDLIDVVQGAATSLGVIVPMENLYRIAIIGNGFPYYAHLIGKTVLIEAVIQGCHEVTRPIYEEGIKQAVSQSLQELKVSYEAATQRGEDYFRHMLWALAEFEFVDIRVDDWRGKYESLCRTQGWTPTDTNRFSNATNNMRKENHGGILQMTPAKYGSTETRYRYRRFKNPLMKGYIRLRAEAEGYQLGDTPLL